MMASDLRVKVLRHGRFVPSERAIRGDAELGIRAAMFWDDLRLSDVPSDRFDGVDIWEREDGSTVVRLITRDMFKGIRLICELDPDTGKPL